MLSLARRPGQKIRIGEDIVLVVREIRGEEELDERFRNDPQGVEDPVSGGRYAVQSYLEHQGDKLAARFDPGTYVALTEALSSHDVGRGRGVLRCGAGAAGVNLRRTNQCGLGRGRIDFDGGDALPGEREIAALLRRRGTGGGLQLLQALAIEALGGFAVAA